MKQSIDKLFVYGSLRSGFHHPAYSYISRYFTLLGAGKVKGHLYDMGNYPAAVPVPTSNDAYLTGELYKINNENELSWALEQLDDYEGLNVEAGETPLYKREPATISIDNEAVEAWVYWYNGDVTGQPLIASGDVLEFLHQKSKL